MAEEFDLKKRLGCRKSPWDHERLKYMVRSPTYEEVLTIPDEWDGLADILPCLGNQGNIGDCCGWSAKGLEYALALLQDKRTVNFSAGSIYLHSRDYIDPPPPPSEEGSTPLAVMKLLADKGATTEECTPTPTQEPFFPLKECENWQEIAKDFKIVQYHQVPTDPASIKAAIYGITYPQPYTMPDGSPGKCPLYIAIPVYQSFLNANTNGGIVPMPQPGELLLGGHAILIRGWKKINNVDYWILVNSWGTDVGDKGIYYLPVGYPIDEAWMITEDQPEPGPEPTPVPEQPLTITTTSPLPDGTVGVAYSQALAASGGESPYSWSIASGSLPAGLSLSSGGVITGTPSVVGASSFTIQVIDELQNIATQSLSITINATPAPSPCKIGTGFAKAVNKLLKFSSHKGRLYYK